jgi:hypothetical protein
MKRAMILGAVLAVAFLSLGDGLTAQEKKNEPPPFVDDVKIDAAIKKGIAYLKGQSKNLRKFDHIGRKMQEDELVLLTMVHAGVPDNDPDFERLFKEMMERRLEATYCVALQAMILEEVGRARYQWRIHQCAQFLVDNQSADGFWGYGSPSIYVEDIKPVPTGAPKKDVASAGGIKEFGGGAAAAPPPAAIHRKKEPVRNKIKVEKKRDGEPNDHSNSQYAALGLRACHDSGIILPEAVIAKADKWWRESQKDAVGTSEEKNVKAEPLELQGAVPVGKPGATVATAMVVAEPFGWCYGKHGDHKAYGSMTTGAIGALAIFDYIKDNDDGRKQSWKRDKDVHQGLQWINKKFSVTYNPGPYEHDNMNNNSKNQYYYYLYALERVGMLYGTELIGSHWWYPEGAKVLLAAQGGGGEWENVVNTCFAILFLRRATRPLTASQAAGGNK